MSGRRYCLLGRVIEKCGGLPYGEYVRRHVLSPAHAGGMQIGSDRAADGEVRYYSHDGGDPYRLPMGRMDAQGAWIATPTDAVKVVAGIFSARDNEGAPPILSESSLATTTTGTSANPHYGCGWILTPAGNCWHTGSLPGTSSLMVHTAKGVSWVAALNTRSADPKAPPALDRMLWQFARSPLGEDLSGSGSS